MKLSSKKFAEKFIAKDYIIEKGRCKVEAEMD